MKQLVASLATFAAVGLACARDAPPHAVTLPSAPASASAPASTASTASHSAASTVPPPPTMSTTAAPPRDEVRGTGACRTDTDCELTSYQIGCCTGTCEEYASAKAELARLRAKENCNAPHACPRPSPCPVSQHHPIAAVCRANVCTTVRELRPTSDFDR